MKLNIQEELRLNLLIKGIIQDLLGDCRTLNEHRIIQEDLEETRIIIGIRKNMWRKIW
jgi:hypothetical protein